MSASQSWVDVVVFVHLLTLLAAPFGALLVARWPRLIWAHLAVLVWVLLLGLFPSLPCPLTVLELSLRRAAGLPTYDVGFLQQYVFPALGRHGEILFSGVEVTLIGDANQEQRSQNDRRLGGTGGEKGCGVGGNNLLLHLLPLARPLM